MEEGAKDKKLFDIYYYTLPNTLILQKTTPNTLYCVNVTQYPSHYNSITQHVTYLYPIWLLLRDAHQKLAQSPLDNDPCCFAGL